MKSYTKIYFDFFNYSFSEFIKCEVCGKQAVDIHHILARSKQRDLLNEILNIMALCRDCHVKYGDKKQYLTLLVNTHIDFIKNENSGFKIDKNVPLGLKTILSENID